MYLIKVAFRKWDKDIVVSDCYITTDMGKTWRI